MIWTKSNLSLIIHIWTEDLYFEYHEVIKYGRGDQIQKKPKGDDSLYVKDLITPGRSISPHNISKMIPHYLYLRDFQQLYV